MALTLDDLPDDAASLKALLLAERARHAGEAARIQAERDVAIAERDRWLGQVERLRHIVRQLQRAQFGRRSERIDDEQLNLALEDLETAIASSEAAEELADATLAASRRMARRVNRGHLPAHLPREEIVIEPPSKSCPCCGGALHVIGEDVSERLDKVPAKLKVIVTRRPKYACRSCTVSAPPTTYWVQRWFPLDGWWIGRRRYRVGFAMAQGSSASRSASVVACGRFSKMWRRYVIGSSPQALAVSIRL